LTKFLVGLLLVVAKGLTGTLTVHSIVGPPAT
jgi:hypothetical protein